MKGRIRDCIGVIALFALLIGSFYINLGIGA